jgi:hypothetical protein
VPPTAPQTASFETPLPSPDASVVDGLGAMVAARAAAQLNGGSL